MLGRIFSHRRGRRTVVAAPLVRVDGDEPGTADEPAPPADVTPPDPAPRPAPPEPPAPVVRAAEPEPRAPEPRAPEREAAAPEPAAGGAAGHEHAPPAGPAGAEEPGPRTRLCRTCGGRVPVAEDGRRCQRGHRISPAHAEHPRGGWLRRLLGRG